MILYREYRLLGAALLIALAGYLIDRSWGGDAFARSGSVIVAYGAAFAGMEIFGLERSITKHEARVEKLEAAYLDAAKKGQETNSEDAFARLATNLAEYRAQRVESVGRMIRAEIIILCLGTLIWGFGDLAF